MAHAIPFVASSGKVGRSFLQMWVDGQMKVVLCPKQCESLLRHAHEELGPFWGPTDI